MVRATAWRTPDGLYTKLRVTGHAMAVGSEDTFDLVCAAVSAIAQTAVIGIEEHLQLRPVVDISSGYLMCVVPEDCEQTMKLRASDILAAAWYGLKAVEEQHPEHIAVTVMLV